MAPRLASLNPLPQPHLREQPLRHLPDLSALPQYPSFPNPELSPPNSPSCYSLYNKADPL